MPKQALSSTQITALDTGFEKIIERGIREGKSPAELATVLNEAVVLTHNEGIESALIYVAAAAEEWAGPAHRIS